MPTMSPAATRTVFVPPGPDMGRVYGQSFELQVIPARRGRRLALLLDASRARCTPRGPALRPEQDVRAWSSYLAEECGVPSPGGLHFPSWSNPQAACNLTSNRSNVMGTLTENIPAVPPVPPYAPDAAPPAAGRPVPATSRISLHPRPTLRRTASSRTCTRLSSRIRPTRRHRRCSIHRTADGRTRRLRGPLDTVSRQAPRRSCWAPGCSCNFWSELPKDSVSWPSFHSSLRAGCSQPALCCWPNSGAGGEGRARHRDELRRIRPLCRCPPPCRPIRCRHVLLQLPAVSPGSDRHGHRVIPGIRRHLTNHFVAGLTSTTKVFRFAQSGLVDVSQLWIRADHKGPPAAPALRSPRLFLRCAGAAFLALVGQDVPVCGYAVGDLSSSSSRRLERNLNAIPTATMTTREPARTNRPAPGSGTAMIVAAMKRSATICGQVIMRFFGTAILIRVDPAGAPRS